MNLAQNGLKKYGFNRRALTEEDFYRICQAEGIEVLEKDVSTSFYFSYGDRHFIVLAKRLDGLRKLFAMYHELTHFFFHGGASGMHVFRFGRRKSKEETEANAFATIALIPRDALRSDDFLSENPTAYAKTLFEDRARLEFLYKI